MTPTPSKLRLERAAEPAPDWRRKPSVPPLWLRSRVNWLCWIFGFNFEDFASSRRSTELVNARQQSSWVLRRWPNMGVCPSFPEVAAALGKRSHSSIVHMDQTVCGDSEKLARATALLERARKECA